jgi:hypothetical protein
MEEGSAHMELRTATQSNMVDCMTEIMVQETERVVSGRRSAKTIIFGAGSRGIVLHEILKSMGHKVAYFIDSNRHGATVCGIPVHEPAKIMHEGPDDVFVIVAADLPAGMIDVLKGFGLLPGTHVKTIFDRQSLDNGTPHFYGFDMLDYFLGYNRSSDLPGFRYDGSERTGRSHTTDSHDELRMVVLGSSTTDPGVIDPVDWDDPDKREHTGGAWPRLFHEMLNRQGIKNSIYNGALGGYTSGQEVLKLFRDCLALSPDMIINVDGLNDACGRYWYGRKYPKVHSHFKVLSGIVEPFLAQKSEERGTEASGGMCYGVEPQISALDEWISNQRIMRAVCNEFDIQYTAFLEPGGIYLDGYLQSCDVRYRAHWFLWNFFNGRGHMLHEYAGPDYGTAHNGTLLREMLSGFCHDVFDRDVDGRKHFNLKDRKIEEFYQDARETVRKNDFIIDIVDAFNGCPEALYDVCHCTAEGYTRIAERIHRELTDRGILAGIWSKITARNKE